MLDEKRRFSATSLFVRKVVFITAGTISVDTDSLWDAVKRFERIAVDIEDYSTELDAIRAELAGAYSRDDYIMRVDSAKRKMNSIAYSLRDISGKLMFTANRYAEYDKYMKQQGVK